MPNSTVNTNRFATNAEILSAFYYSGGDFVQRMLNPFNVGDMNAIMQQFMTNPGLWNQLVDSLVNQLGRIIFSNRSYVNKLAFLKKGDLPFGAAIEDVFVSPIAEQRYDDSANYPDPFAKYVPDISTTFYRVNRQGYFPVTIQMNSLRQAFTSEYGLNELIANQMLQLAHSDQIAEYKYSRDLISTAENEHPIFKVHVDDFTTLTGSARADAGKFITEQIRAMSGRLEFMSTAYNQANVYTFTPRENLVLFATPELEALLDVNVVAQAFQMDRAVTAPARIITLDTLGVPGMVALLADRDWFQIYDQLLAYGEIYNPRGLYGNNYLHHWQLYAAAAFKNAVGFWTGEGTAMPETTYTVDSIEWLKDGSTVTGVTVNAGDLVKLQWNVKGTSDNPAGIAPPQAVTLSTVSWDGAKQMSRTVVDQDGWLRVAEQQKGATWVVRATSVYDTTKTADITITIAG